MAKLPALVLGVGAAFVVAIAWVGSPARADDPAPERKQVPKIENAFLEGLVGSWNVAFDAGGDKGTGAMRVRWVAGGTALLEESVVTARGKDFYATNVVRVDDGGKTVKVWKFDATSGAEVAALKGPLTAEGLDLDGEQGTHVALRKKDADYVATITPAGRPPFAVTYSKAAKDAEIGAPDAPKDGHRPAMIGTWDVVGQWTMPGPDGKTLPMSIDGTSTFRWTIGGRGMTHEYDRKAPFGPMSAFGVHRWPEDGSSTKVWWFDMDQVDPMLAEGAATDDAWHGKGTMDDGKTIGLEWSKKGEGFEMKYEIGGKPSGVETYAKKK